MGIKITFDDDILGTMEVEVGPKAKAIKESPVKMLNRVVNDILDGVGVALPAPAPPDWEEDSAVVLIHVQECEACGTRHEFTHGWFTGKRHSRDRTARLLTAGKPLTNLPRVVQRVDCGKVPVCGACAEAQILIEEAAFHD